MAVFSGGQYVDLARLLEQLVPLYVIKGSDESVVSSTTVQDDDELFIANIPVGTWQLSGELWVAGTSGINQDVKYGWTFPAGTLTWSGGGLHPDWANSASNRDVVFEGDVLDTSSPSNARAYGTVTGGNIPTQISGILQNTAAGTLQLQWAQNTSNADDTTLKAGSWLCLRKLDIS